MNVLYVTTRQWNPGDEFIQFGVKRILTACGIRPRSEAIYNKSPQVKTLFERLNFWKRDYLQSKLAYLDFALNITHYDNSLKRNTPLEFFDYVVFSGSPGWRGGRLRDLYQNLRDFKGKIIFLGIGMPNRSVRLTDLEWGVLRQSVIICRDTNLISELNERHLSADFLPCPALFSAPERENKSNSINRIGLVFSTIRTHRNQAIAPEQYAQQNTIYQDIVRNYDAFVICHYIDEIDDAVHRFGRERVIYWYNASDYIATYSTMDYVISSRVHGCGIASSLGIPNLYIPHDARADTVHGFKSTMWDRDMDVLAFLRAESRRYTQRVSDLYQHRRNTEEAYKGLVPGKSEPRAIASS